MSRANTFLALLLVLSLTLAGLVFFGRPEADGPPGLKDFQLRGLAARFGLTDLSLWTEARYTRHPSQSDRFSAFQDFPGSFDHFPAGSIVNPPASVPTR